MVTEVWGLHEGISGTIYLRIDKKFVDGDNLAVIQAIKNCENFLGLLTIYLLI